MSHERITVHFPIATPDRGMIWATGTCTQTVWDDPELRAEAIRIWQKSYDHAREHAARGDGEQA